MQPKVRTGLIIAAIIIGTIVLWMVYTKVKAKMSAFKRTSENKAEVSVLQSQGQTKSYTIAEYQRMGRQLYTAMAGMGTDEQSIYNVMGKLNNDLDFLGLDAGFGMKDGYSMQEWFDGDLSQSEKGKINNMMNSSGLTKRI